MYALVIFVGPTDQQGRVSTRQYEQALTTVRSWDEYRDDGDDAPVGAEAVEAWQRARKLKAPGALGRLCTAYITSEAGVSAV